MSRDAGPAPDGFVKDAMGQTGSCCSPAAQTFTKLAEGDLDAGAQTPPIRVGTYREVVVHIKSPVLACDWDVLFRPNSSAPFGGTGQFLGVNGIT